MCTMFTDRIFEDAEVFRVPPIEVVNILPAGVTIGVLVVPVLCVKCCGPTNCCGCVVYSGRSGKAIGVKHGVGRVAVLFRLAGVRIP